MDTKVALCVAWLLVLVGGAVGQDKGKAEVQVPPGVVYEKDIAFGKGGETTLQMDVARPRMRKRSCRASW